jgi:hypothetical protein
MKTKLSLLKSCLLIAVTLIFVGGGNISNAQNYSPNIEWRTIDFPDDVPAGPYISGINGTVPGSAQTRIQSGEDWWYDVEPYYEGGVQNGFVAGGYATWLNLTFDETNAGGVDDPDEALWSGDANQALERPLLENETLSGKLITMSRYDDEGKMVWCKSYAQADEGAYQITPTADGGYAFIGWSKATIDKFGNPLKLNPGSGTPFNMNTHINANDNHDTRDFKIIAGKIDSDGNLIWINSYCYFDMGGAFTDYEVLNNGAQGYDILGLSNNHILLIGSSEFEVNNDETKCLIIELDANGNIIQKQMIGQPNYSFLPKEIEPNLTETEFYITGIQIEQVLVSNGGYHPKGDAVLFKIDASLNQLPFATDSWNGGTAAVRYTTNTTYGSEYFKQNIGWDVKVLNNGKVAWAFIEDCKGCLYSGRNRGQGKIFLYDEVAGNVNFIDLQNINTVGFTQVQAFDMKIGLIETRDGGFACVTTVKGQDIPPALLNTITTDIDNKVNNGLTTPAYNIEDYWSTDAYVAKFDGNGNLIWDKQWDANDGPAQLYPGDYKEQECLYRIVEDKDGGLIVCGNSSFNKDDYYLTKIQSDCPYYTDYDIYSQGDLVIQGTTVWNANTNTIDPSGIFRVRNTIRIPSGATLIIDNLTVEFADSRYIPESQGIIVEPGGKLVVKNNAKLTALSNCNDNFEWTGIVVQGDPTLLQDLTIQGYVSIDHSTIENAIVAVSCGTPFLNLNDGGAYAYLNNSTFINNFIDLYVNDYQAYNSSNNVIINHSSVYACNFIRNDDYKNSFMVDGMASNIQIGKTTGIKITNSNFTDNRTNQPQYLTTHIYYFGISSGDASYKVNNCSFTNLYSGIRAANYSTENTITVDLSTFNNNYIGVNISAVHSPTIIRNTFNIDNATNNFANIATYHIGVYANHTNEIRVEENTFNNLNTNQSSYPLNIGLRLADIGETNTETYKNTYNNQHIATYVSGVNRGAGATDGLQFICNDNSTNRVDHYVANSNTPQHGIRFWQGQATQNNLTSTGNNFTQNGNSNEDFWNNPFVVSPVNYIYGTGSQTPVEYYGIITTPANNSKNCPTHYPTYPPNGSGLVYRQQLKTDYTTANNKFLSKQSNYYNLLNGGNTQTLLTQISSLTPENQLELRQLLLKYSPYLSVDVVKATIDNPPSKYPHLWALELVLANIDLARQPGFMDFLANKQYPMPNWMYETIKNKVKNATLTDKEIKTLEIATQSYKKDFASDMLIRSYKNDTNNVALDSIAVWVDKKENVSAKIRLIDIELQKGNYETAQLKINELNNTINNYPAFMTVELNDVIVFKTKIRQLLAQNGTLANIEKGDKLFFEQMAENGHGIAKLQAQELLCFYFNQCYETPLELPNLTNGKMKAESPQENITERLLSFKMYPNPANDWVAIELPIETQSAIITIVDLNGRVVLQEQTNIPLYIWTTNAMTEGVYIINVTNLEGTQKIGAQKIIIQH